MFYAVTLLHYEQSAKSVFVLSITCYFSFLPAAARCSRNVPPIELLVCSIVTCLDLICPWLCCRNCASTFAIQAAPHYSCHHATTGNVAVAQHVDSADSRQQATASPADHCRGSRQSPCQPPQSFQLNSPTVANQHEPLSALAVTQTLEAIIVRIAQQTAMPLQEQQASAHQHQPLTGISDGQEAHGGDRRLCANTGSNHIAADELASALADVMSMLCYSAQPE